jgi:hypothetical protein
MFVNDDQLTLALCLLKATDREFAVNGMNQRSLKLEFLGWSLSRKCKLMTANLCISLKERSSEKLPP